MDQPLVSVVITTRNEAKNIGRCLEAVSYQTWPALEVIVVDNNSSDATTELAREYTSLVFDKGPERSAQRNYGLLEIAQGKYGMFLDADMIITPQLVESCVQELTRSNLCALHIEELILGRGALASVRRFERSFYSGTVIDGIRFFDRQMFKEFGGFDATLPPGPEDWDLDKKFKLRGSIALLPSKGSTVKWQMEEFVNSRGINHRADFVGLYHNEDEQPLRKYLAKKAYYSGSMAAYIEKWPEDDDVAKQLGFTYRYLTVFTESGKWRSLVRHPVLTLGLLCLRFLVGVVFLQNRRTSDE
jgi:glycosyltransferase involved in cell wall biosynthesis